MIQCFDNGDCGQQKVLQKNKSSTATMPKCSFLKNRT